MLEVKHLARMWREAMPEDRAVVYFLGLWAGILLIVGLWAG